MACPSVNTEPDQSDSDNPESSGGMSSMQLLKVVLGVFALIAGAFLVTLMIRVRHQDDEPKFE